MLFEPKIQFGRRGAMLMSLAAFLSVPLMAQAETDQQSLVRKAETTLETARQDQQFGMAAKLFKTAKAVMVVPQLVKGGFLIGGEGGNAVLLQPTMNGGWRDPLFYTMGAVSFGLQAGGEVAEVVLFVMSDRALKAWTGDEVALGAKAGLTVLVVGTNVEANTTTNGDFDVIAWAKAKGAYAGITLEGSLIKPRDEWNTAYYGHAVSPAQMLKLSAN